MEYNGHMLRHEHKYIINYHEYSYLKPRLEAIMQKDPYSVNGSYFIRSLYFDDMFGTAYSEKESGVEFRRKYRIRIYNGSDSVIKLERKEKFADFISKSSAGITKEQFYEIIKDGDISFMLQSDNKLMQDMYAEIRTAHLSPAVIVDYTRDVLVYNEGNVRVTFDRDIAAGIDTPDVFSPSVTTVRAIEPDLMVMEVKYDDFLPEIIRRALAITSHRKEAFSKYVYCRQAQMKHNPSAAVLFR